MYMILILVLIFLPWWFLVVYVLCQKKHTSFILHHRGWLIGFMLSYRWCVLCRCVGVGVALSLVSPSIFNVCTILLPRIPVCTLNFLYDSFWFGLVCLMDYVCK